MHPPRRLEVGLVAGAFAGAAALAAVAERPLADLLFLGVLLSCLLLMARLVASSAVRSHRTSRRERDLVRVQPGHAARRAVEEERARLSAEIDLSVRRSLNAVTSLVAAAEEAVDPRPSLIAIQAESRTAMSELRRQLGLIVADNDPRVQDPSFGGPDAASATSAAWPLIRRMDVATVIALCALIAAEQALVTGAGRPASWLMSALMALTVLTRRLAADVTALAGATVLILGVVIGAPVGDGFSFPIVTGLLLWSVLEQRPTPAAAASAAALVGCAVGSRYAHEPANGPINLVVLSVVGLTAYVVGRGRRFRAASEQRAEGHQTQLAIAREAAARATRREVAHDLHDVVSHAVSLVAVQAGAAELAWPHQPAATRAGLRAMQETVSDALADLDGRGWGQGPVLVGGDVAHTVDRLRRVGLTVSLETSGRIPEDLQPTVHRLVQEALTNVLKHAPGANASVLIASDPDRIRVEVVDNGPGPAPALDGYGLAGLRDRVTACGGTLSAGPSPRGGFAVRAVLPHMTTQTRRKVTS